MQSFNSLMARAAVAYRAVLQLEPTDALTCEFQESDATWALASDGEVLGGCGALAAALRSANATTNVTV